MAGPLNDKPVPLIIKGAALWIKGPAHLVPFWVPEMGFSAEIGEDGYVLSFWF